jgi:hypothetical protein
VLFMPMGSSSDTVVGLGVRETNVYSHKGQPMQAMTNNSIQKMDREKIALKVV